MAVENRLCPDRTKLHAVEAQRRVTAALMLIFVFICKGTRWSPQFPKGFVHFEASTKKKPSTIRSHRTQTFEEILLLPVFALPL